MRESTKAAALLWGFLLLSVVALTMSIMWSCQRANRQDANQERIADALERLAPKEPAK